MLRDYDIYGSDGHFIETIKWEERYVFRSPRNEITLGAELRLRKVVPCWIIEAEIVDGAYVHTHGMVMATRVWTDGSLEPWCLRPPTDVYQGFRKKRGG